MNTCSVSVNKNISESGKVGIKSKANKPDDKFKDMIKNASTKSTSEKSEQVSKETEDVNGKNLNGRQDQNEPEPKEDNTSMSNLASLIVSSANMVDSGQLVKMVSLSMGETTETMPLVAIQNAMSQAEGSKAEGAAKSSVQTIQMVPVVNGESKTEIMQKLSVVNATEISENGTTGAKPIQTGKQQAVGEPNVVQQHSATGLKQEVSSDKENKSGAMSQETETLDSSAITTAELKMKPLEGTSDTVVTIKVAEPSLDASWKQVAEEIGNLVVEKINQEVQKVSVTLNPKDLGEIDVAFVIHGDKISVSLNCSNEATKTLLANNIDSLSKVVQSSLMQDVNVNLTHDKMDGQNANSENFDGRGSNSHYQEDSQNKKKQQQQPDLDFIQRLRLGIEDAEV